MHAELDSRNMALHLSVQIAHELWRRCARRVGQRNRPNARVLEPLQSVGNNLRPPGFVVRVSKGHRKINNQSRSEEHTSELQSQSNLVCRLLLEKKTIVMAIAKDSHKNAETRRDLQPIVDLAADLKASLLGVTHFTKGTEGRSPIDRLTVSLAFGALARVVMVAAKKQDEDDKPGVRIFMRAKSN